MTVEGSVENIKSEDKLAAAMEESAVEGQDNSQKEASSKPKEDPRIAGLMQEVPEAQITETPTTKLGPSTTITPLTPPATPQAPPAITPRPPAASSTTPTVEATPLTKAAETKQPKRR